MAKLDTLEINIREYYIQPSDAVCNICGIFDSEMKIDAQLAKVCKSGWCQLCQIGKLKPYLSIEETKHVVHAYITSNLDQNNSLLGGIKHVI